MHTSNVRRGVRWALVAALAVGLLGTALVGGIAARGGGDSDALGFKLNSIRPGAAEKELAGNWQGSETGGPGGESFEALTAATQLEQARSAPGVVKPGAYGAAFTSLKNLSPAGGSWASVTGPNNGTPSPYDADDPWFRDFYSNSSGGAGQVTGRITGLTAGTDGTVYAAGAAGGVFRSTTGGGNWTAIADQLPGLSSGALELDSANDALWYATGEANTGGTSFVGSGVYRLPSPKTGTFTTANRVGGDELESTTINSIRFTATKVWVATSRGVWSHSRTGSEPHWELSLVPSPAYLPATPYSGYLQNKDITLGGSDTQTIANVKNVVNDLAIDPRNANHLVAAVGFRSGDAYNGFYETTDGGAHWVKVNPTGAINPKEIGNTTFAYTGTGQLYAMVQSITLMNKLTGVVNSVLAGIYVSNSGNPAGPWSQIADQTKLANSGSALKQSVSGKGYGPGVQAWYNQFLVVDPNDSNHVFAGLEEVYETKNGGATWNTVGPYWNFYFSCWRVDSLYAPNGSKGCPQSPHSDQHSAAIGKVGGVWTLFVGNDGGVYKRPLNGQLNGNGNGTDWASLNDGTIDTLQYYAVGVGNTPAAGYKDPVKQWPVRFEGALGGTGSVIVSGGLQDNGGSIKRVGAPKMSSNFGGDGGDVLVDPNNGCNIVQEYINLAMRLTQNCASPTKDGVTPNFDSWLLTSDETTYSIKPPDINARFIAPFAASASNIDQWVAGGNTLWYQDKGFAIRSGSDWKPAYALGGGGVRVATSVAFDKDTIVAGWCGSCSSSTFVRGLVVLRRGADGTWTKVHEIAPWKVGDLTPNRYIGGVAIDPANENHLVAVFGGFSATFIEGPGAGNGHVYESNDGGATWTKIDGASFPDIPANAVKFLPGGRVVVGTDLGIVVSDPAAPLAARTWKRLGGTTLPATTTLDLELHNGVIYAATHGRGIWSIPTP